jgi:hypothetical protein
VLILRQSFPSLEQITTPWGQNTHATMRISARTGCRPLWCSHSP